MGWESICAMTALQLRAELAAGHLSAREILQAHLEAIEHWNPTVNAIVTLDVEGARRRAAAADQAQARGEPLGLLHGLPVAHKDSFLTAGMRTTHGSPVFADFVPERSSLVVTRQQAAGAITLGKTNLPEFGAGSQTFNAVFGPTRNPYDPAMTAGGSSGGAAAALACRMVPLADGTDMGGSLRNPASFCNVVGLRPSPGRVPMWPTAAPYNTLSVAGPMARTVGDAALMLAALAGPDARDPLTIDADPGLFLGALERDFAGTRVAYAPDWGGLPVDPAVGRVLQAQLPRWEELGCRVDQACPDFGQADSSFHALRGLAFAINQGETVRRHRDRVKDTVIWNTELGLNQSGAVLAQAERDRAQLFERMHDFMQQYEFLIGPVSQVPPFSADQEYIQRIGDVEMRNYIDWMRSGYYLSLTGHPAISVPCGFTETGLPIGIQIVGRYRDERGVLQLAHAFEQLTQCWRQAPALRAPAA
ncbi:amidase [Bordetella bronchiseptica]|uniref:Amidase n=2 Tax=Bordetella bronchiseptica TaxID=518 RepID=A0ABR4RGK4_BORBO|nr:amidase [Bordetella bronchiseptica]SHP82309.1 amidase [Mycobacteroides abscessus subsp. abscessus]AWP77440.1 amidase [Bordetella bronchiseptica]AZW24277.1 amidase [Bordetella bronchiseptica]KAB1451718.1 amidase [Bordetella bronchiseptica]KAB1576962.1 amidase [Bordetella bronchiseptica]